MVISVIADFFRKKYGEVPEDLVDKFEAQTVEGVKAVDIFLASLSF